MSALTPIQMQFRSSAGEYFADEYVELDNVDPQGKKRDFILIEKGLNENGDLEFEIYYKIDSSLRALPITGIEQKLPATMTKEGKIIDTRKNKSVPYDAPSLAELIDYFKQSNARNQEAEQSPRSAFAASLVAKAHEGGPEEVAAALEKAEAAEASRQAEIDAEALRQTQQQQIVSNTKQLVEAIKQPYNSQAARLTSQDVKALLDAGADPNYQVPHEGLVLMLAIKRKEKNAAEIVKLLLDGGADPLKAPTDQIFSLVSRRNSDSSITLPEVLNVAIERTPPSFEIYNLIIEAVQKSARPLTPDALEFAEKQLTLQMAKYYLELMKLKIDIDEDKDFNQLSPQVKKLLKNLKQKVDQFRNKTTKAGSNFIEVNTQNSLGQDIFDIDLTTDGIQLKKVTESSPRPTFFSRMMTALFGFSDKKTEKTETHEYTENLSFAELLPLKEQLKSDSAMITVLDLSKLNDAETNQAMDNLRKNVDAELKINPHLRKLHIISNKSTLTAEELENLPKKLTAIFKEKLDGTPITTIIYQVGARTIEVKRDSPEVTVHPPLVLSREAKLSQPVHKADLQKKVPPPPTTSTAKLPPLKEEPPKGPKK